MAYSESQKRYEYRLWKYLRLVSTLVATVTYTVGFNPPGGVWQDSDGHLAGDPIILTTHYRRYMAFFYCNAIAFASSLAVIFLIPLLAFRQDGKVAWIRILSQQVLMVLDLFSLIGAYAAWTCRETLMTVYSLLLVAAAFTYIMVQMVMGSRPQDGCDNSDYDAVLEDEERLRKVLMLLAMFAVGVTYVAGLSTPGGFWDNAEHGHTPGDEILKDHHSARLTAFFACNTASFVASLLIIVLLLLQTRLRQKTVRSRELYRCITVALVGLVGAYAAGSCRETETTVYVVGLFGAVLAYILFQVYVVRTIIASLSGRLQAIMNQDPPASTSSRRVEQEQQAEDNAPSLHVAASEGNTPTEHCSEIQRAQSAPPSVTAEDQNVNGSSMTTTMDAEDEQLNQARSFVLLLATLAATITYQAGLDPPGGVWQDNGDDHMAGDPVLLTTNPRRYKSFFYCNSIAFVASLVAIILVQEKLVRKNHVLVVAMVLDLFGLIGAYAAGSCREVNTSVYVIALAIAVMVYVVMHIFFFDTDHEDSGSQHDNLVEKRRKRLLLFAILAATITYQAGLTPPGGFLLHDDDFSRHQAGDSVLLYNSPQRYKAFFYCNSVSFMLSIAMIILLVNPRLYTMAIRSYALSVCTAVGLFALMGAYAAGSTQHWSTTTRIIALLVVVFVVIIVLVLVLVLFKGRRQPEGIPILDGSRHGEKMDHSKRKKLMLLGILVASVTYQAGLDPPGGVWQSTGGDGQGDAGSPVMHDNRRHRYIAFFYCNSASFVASIIVIILLLPRSLQGKPWWLSWMNTTIVLDLIGLLVAYAAGSCREWKATVYVLAPAIAVLAYFVIHLMLSNRLQGNHPQLQQQGNGTM